MPTISGREEWLARALAGFEQHTVVDYEMLMYVDRPSCGAVWQEGGEEARGAYIYMAADDCFPMDGWDEAAIEACDRNVLPAPRIWNPDGTIQSCGDSWGALEPDGAPTGFTRAPFMSRAQWDAIQPMLPCHYFTDNWVSFRGRLADIPTVVTYGFQLIHHLAKEGRNEGRMGIDGRIYQRACKGEDVWHES